MTPADVQRLLAAGIEAVKLGHAARARQLLMQVIEADERNEQAWLWLSAVVGSLEDQITALENVLEINPHNPAARKGLDHLRSRQPGGEAGLPPPPAEPSPAALLSQTPAAASQTGTQEERAFSPLESVSELDDPYQCVYCGAPAARELRRCPECGRSLMVKQGSGRLTPSIRNATFVMLVCAAFAGIEAGALAILSFQGQGALVSFVFTTLGLNHLFGDYAAWPGAWGQPVFWIQLSWLVTVVVVTLAFLYQFALAYPASVGAMVLNVLWATIRWVAGFLGPTLAVADVVASLAALFFVFAAQPDFQVNLSRLRCAADPRIKGGEALHKLGQICRNQNQWALAVAHWRAAVAAMPAQADFYKDLAIGYAQIGHYRRSLRALAEFSRLRPDDPDTPLLKTTIEQKQAIDPRPRG